MSGNSTTSINPTGNLSSFRRFPSTIIVLLSAIYFASREVWARPRISRTMILSGTHRLIPAEPGNGLVMKVTFLLLTFHVIGILNLFRCRLGMMFPLEGFLPHLVDIVELDDHQVGWLKGDHHFRTVFF